MSEARHLLLPNFCEPRAVLGVLLIVALTALMLALAAAGFGSGFWTALARAALFLVWIGLAGAALLCGLRRYIARQPAAAGAVVALGCLALLVAAVSLGAWFLMSSAALNPGGLLGTAPQDRWLFLARNVAIGLLVAGLALRYFYVTQQWRLNVESRAHARVNALQARIRPHFLYNSMNTIAALTRSDPALAEEAVQDLSDLFRAALSEKRSLIPLKEELEIARIYQRIEQLRLGERLRVRWNVRELPMRALVPSLTIQPLLENAIGHGIENLPGGGEVIIDGAGEDDLITIAVRNPISTAGNSRSGHGIALDNIRERFILLYGARAEVAAGREGGEFIVRLKFPYTLAPEAAP
ncbi:MAG: sensor histidine kinase [Steroidobacteraceae bacterium]